MIKKSTEKGISTKKSILILSVVVICLATLWPSIFWPILKQILCGNSNIDQLAAERANNERMLPPRVREAMGFMPHTRTLEPNANLLPGRPQFYTGPRNGDFRTKKKSADEGSNWLSMVLPVYTIGIGFFFLFFLIKYSMSKKEDENEYSYLYPQSKTKKRCPECTAAQESLSQTLKANQHRDPLLERTSYRAFARCGHGNVRDSLSSLIHDMQTFRNHLIMAQVVKCKMQKYELARKANENCIHEEQEQEPKENEVSSEENGTVVDDQDERLAEKQVFDEQNLPSLTEESKGITPLAIARVEQAQEPFSSEEDKENINEAQLNKSLEKKVTSTEIMTQNADSSKVKQRKKLFSWRNIKNKSKAVKSNLKNDTKVNCETTDERVCYSKTFDKKLLQIWKGQMYKQTKTHSKCD